MGLIEQTNSEVRTVVDDVRAARAAVTEEAGGLDRLGDYLRNIQSEYHSRTGRFAGIPRKGSPPDEDASPSARARS